MEVDFMPKINDLIMSCYSRLFSENTVECGGGGDCFIYSALYSLGIDHNDLGEMMELRARLAAAYEELLKNKDKIEENWMLEEQDENGEDNVERLEKSHAEVASIPGTVSLANFSGAPVITFLLQGDYNKAAGVNQREVGCIIADTQGNVKLGASAMEIANLFSQTPKPISIAYWPGHYKALSQDEAERRKFVRGFLNLKLFQAYKRNRDELNAAGDLDAKRGVLNRYAEELYGPNSQETGEIKKSIAEILSSCDKLGGEEKTELLSVLLKGINNEAKADLGATGLHTSEFAMLKMAKTPEEQKNMLNMLSDEAEKFNPEKRPFSIVKSKSKDETRDGNKGKTIDVNF